MQFYQDEDAEDEDDGVVFPQNGYKLLPFCGKTTRQLGLLKIVLK